MNDKIRWEKCRYEGCGRALSGSYQFYGFCGANCCMFHREDMEFHLREAENALENFKREGEPNKGGSR